MKTFSSCFSQGAKIHLGITYFCGAGRRDVQYLYRVTNDVLPPIYFLFRASCIVASVSYSILPNNQLFVFRYSILLPSNLTNIFSKARHQTDSLTASLLLRFSECIKMFLHFSDKTCKENHNNREAAAQQLPGFPWTPVDTQNINLSNNSCLRS